MRVPLPLRSFAAFLFACWALLGFWISIYVRHFNDAVGPWDPIAPNEQGGSAGHCEMSYMSPGYEKLTGFSTEFSRLAGKRWNVYLYRELGWDEPFECTTWSGGHQFNLRGIPVIFIPGNAGSFRQARSFGSAFAHIEHESPGAEPLDLFTVDFDEDFSAFHGLTLHNQAEFVADAIRYIQEGYSTPKPVILLAHSMGGVVARSVLLHPNYVRHSVSAIVTFSAPHAFPPLAMDQDINTIYADMHAYWAAQGSYHDKAVDELQNTVLISISGGAADAMVSPESCVIEDSAIARHLSLFTHSVQGLFSPVDHLAILWCRQLVRRTARALLLSAPNPSRGMISSFAQILLGAEPGGKSADSPLEVQNSELLSDRVFQAGDSGIYNIQKGSRIFVQGDATRVAVLSCAHTCESLPFRKYPITEPASRSKAVHIYTLDSTAGDFLKAVISPGDRDVRIISGDAHVLFAPSLLRMALGLSPKLPLGSFSTEVFLPVRSALPVIKASLSKSCPAGGAVVSFEPLLDVAVHRDDQLYIDSSPHPGWTHARAFSLETGPFSSSKAKSVRVVTFVDPSSPCTYSASFSLDWSSTFAGLASRYRLSGLAFTMAVLFWIHAYTVYVGWNYQRGSKSFETNVAPFFQNAYTSHAVSFARRFVAPCSAAVTLVALMQSLVMRQEPSSHPWVSDALLGSWDLEFVPVVGCILAGAYAIAFAQIVILSALVSALIWMSARISPSATPQPLELADMSSSILSITVITLITLFIVPYRFVYMLLVLSVFCFVVSASRRTDDPEAAINFSLLVMMVELIPHHVMMLAIWVRSLTAWSFAPLSSDHNVTHIIGFILYAESLAFKGRSNIPGNLYCLGHMLLSMGAGLITLLYGVRNTYVAAYALNLLCAYTGLLGPNSLIFRSR